MTAMIAPAPTFRDNLAALPGIEGVARVDLLDAEGAVVASIENQPGKQGSLAVYLYLGKVFGRIDAEAAAHGLQIFGEHTEDARARPGAHPNIDRLFPIAAGGEPLTLAIVADEG